MSSIIHLMMYECCVARASRAHSYLALRKVIHQIKHSSVTRTSCSCTPERVVARLENDINELLDTYVICMARPEGPRQHQHGTRQMHKCSALPLQTLISARPAGSGCSLAAQWFSEVVLGLQSAVLACQVVLPCQAGEARTAVRAVQPAVAARLATVDEWPTTTVLTSCLALVAATPDNRASSQHERLWVSSRRQSRAQLYLSTTQSSGKPLFS